MKLLTLLLLALAPGLSLSAQEIPLFNGRDLTGWEKHTGPADFRVQDGCIVGKNKTVKPGHTFLCTTAVYADFILTFEFKADPGLNSGVQFRSECYPHETKYFARGRAQTRPPDRVFGYQFEIDSRDLRANAAVYDEARRGEFLDDLSRNPAAQAAFKPRDWNEGRIECRGDSIKTFINGVPAAVIVDGLTRSGVIALQVHSGNAPGDEVRWRNIRLLPLAAGMPSPVAAMPPAPLTTVQTDPSQPRVEVLKDQVPNAVEWALTPLDQVIPPDIRQNLTYLREDLLDEGARAPKADAAAYTLGSQLCDKLLLAIEERNQTRARAGYVAAQADADVRVTSQALEARRNYMMSWPQFSREQSQRAELERRQRSGADLKKERSDLEWTARTETLRKYLDDLYRQFREALR